ncbi:Ca2-binding protein [Aureococcus anophagefferens]|nr:Ca2-binding protein [Aureococcus anophagefferens]
MGQSASQNALSSHTTANKPDCFSDEELNNLKRLFDQLARRSPNATVDLEHFLEFFATLPGLHGDQLFIAFDRKKAGALDFDDFVAGMARARAAAFDECDANHEGKLDLAQFEVWVGKTPGVLEFFDASMAQAVSFGAALNHRSKSDENLAGARKRPSFQKSTSFGALAPLGEGEVLEGPLWKATLGARHRRHFKLVSNILYYFKEASDPAPRGLVFLGGCQCEPVDEGELRGFRVVHWDAEKLGERPQQLYAADEVERDKWVAAIRAAIGGKAHALDDFYDVGAELGSGAFASVHEATHRASKDRVAVKHIEKGDKDDDEAKDHREMCRREIAKRITAQDALAHAWISPLMERSSTVTSRDHPAVTGSWFPSDLILPKNDLM